jgi:hypothetical protein
MNTFCEQPIRETRRDSGCVAVEDDRDAVEGEARLCITGRRRFGSSFGNILKFAFELKNMVCRIFGRNRRLEPPSAESARLIGL